MTPFWKSAVTTTAIAGGLLALERAHPSNRTPLVPAWLQSFVRDLVHRGPNEEDESGLLAGYYEDLLNASNATTSPKDPEVAWRNTMRLDETHERTGDFLVFRPRKGLDVVTVAGVRVTTNSLGLSDREYPRAKPEGARRIAFVGDSLVRGLGAPSGRALEPRFEEWLNATQLAPPYATYEVLNFGVEGYRLTQLMDVALEQVPPTGADVVLLGVSDLSASRTFGQHLARLVHEGTDLEYPFLRELVTRAGVERDDTLPEAESKLARVRVEIQRACLATLRDRLRERNVELVAVLLPTVTDSRTLAEKFDEIQVVLRELSIPTLDLLDSFSGADLEQVRVSRVDRHPNEAGYGLLLERLVTRLEEAPATAALLLGHTVQGAH